MTSRLLGIDHGDSRVGLAISDELGAFAHPYRTLQTTPKVVDEIRVIVEREQLSGIIIGVLRAICLLIFPPNKGDNAFIGTLIYFILSALILLVCFFAQFYLDKSRFVTFYVKKA